MDILRKININGVDYDISPRASKDQLGMIQLGSGLCITEDDEVSINIGPGIKYSDDNKTLVIDTDWIDNYIFENYGVSKSEGTTTPKPEEDNLSNYFSIVSLEDNSTISLPTNISPSLMYSLNGIDWTQWDYSTITLGKDDRLYLKGNSNGFSTSYSAYNNFSIIGKVELAGNIMSLLYGNDFKNNNILPGTYTFFRLFYNCTGIISAKDLILPATTLTQYCYESMFESCTSLIEAPELPATTLADYCYQSMFQNCTLLTRAPQLPATTLASNCYYGMFYICSKLNHITMLATDISAADCLSNWVYGVASSGTFVKNSAATWNKTGISGIPEGWTVEYDGEVTTTTTPEPATTTPEPATTTPEPATTTPEPIITTQGVEGDIEWSIDSNGILILSAVEGSSGIMKNYNRGSVDNSGDGADWMECGEKFENIIIEDGVTNIGDLAFGTNWGNTDNIKSVSIPDTVTSIGEGAFCGCSDLTSVIIPNSVTSIGNNAFMKCTGLTSIIIPNSVTSIGGSVFNECRGLTNVTIPNSVTSIEGYAFSYCTGLTEITCLATTPPSLGNSVFFNVPTKSILLYVPTESVDLYKNAEQWKEFNIQAIIEDTTTE